MRPSDLVLGWLRPRSVWTTNDRYTKGGIAVSDYGVIRQERPDSARRYLLLLQPERGTPAPGALPDSKPTCGPIEPMAHSVVMASEYEKVVAERHEAYVCVDELLYAIQETVHTPAVGWTTELRAFAEQIARRLRLFAAALVDA